MDTHPVMRIQFFLDGPFDPLGTLSVSFLNPEYEVIESVVLAGDHAQYELWRLVERVAADFMSTYGLQHQLPLENAETPGQ